MSSSLTEDYRLWLESQIREEHTAVGKDFRQLVALMFEKEFVWLVPNDDNRAADGLDLRAEFCFQQNLPLHSLKNLGPASFLEVLIGLSRRLSFLARGTPRGWAWQLITNLELNKMHDPLTRRKLKQANDILDACIWRTYGQDGQGGFFPLAWPQEDQTKIELWYQISAYIDEQHPEH